MSQRHLFDSRRLQATSVSTSSVRTSTTESAPTPSRATATPPASERPPKAVLDFDFSPFTNVEGVVHDYLYADPCLRDIERQYGPDVRKARKGAGSCWRSQEYQDAKRASHLKKAIHRRKPIFELLDAAVRVSAESADNVTRDLNNLICSHFGLQDTGEFGNKHMEWLVNHLASQRRVGGKSFQERQEMALQAANSRKRYRADET